MSHTYFSTSHHRNQGRYWPRPSAELIEVADAIALLEADPANCLLIDVDRIGLDDAVEQALQAVVQGKTVLVRRCHHDGFFAGREGAE